MLNTTQAVQGYKVITTVKKAVLLFLMFLPALFLSAQARQEQVEYQKTQQQAVIIEFSYPPEVVSAAIKEYFGEKGTKSADGKGGFKKYLNAALDGSTKADLYFKVERKSRREKDESIISLIVGSPDEDIANRLPGSQVGIQQAKDFLNSLAPIVWAYALEVKIEEQNEVVVKQEKRYKNLVEDGQDLTKKKTDIERKIRENEEDQEKQAREVENQKQALEKLFNQRKS